MQKEKNSPGFTAFWLDQVGMGSTEGHALPSRVSRARENGPQETTFSTFPAKLGGCLL